MKQFPYANEHSSNRNAGFTLVEMLVSVALVLLMMSMFATVFIGATDVLSRQRGIAENDQRGRMLSIAIRGDLDGRTFRDLLPFRSGEASNLPSRPLSRRSGYFEIDEGDPGDDTDDVLQFTVSINLPTENPNGLKFTGLAPSLTTQTITSVTATSITIAGDYHLLVAENSYIWLTGTASTIGTTPFSNDGRFLVNGPATFASGATTIPVLATLTVPPSAPYGSALLSEFDPDFDNGIIGDGLASSSYAEVAYFLRNGNLYRRALPIRDTQTSGEIQPQWSTGAPISPLTSNSFWHDFDYSAFFPPATISSQTYISSTISLPVTFPFLPSGSVVLHDATDSLNNSYITDITALATGLSLGLPYQRFGHSINNGLPQDASTQTTLNGQLTSIGRYNLQECSNSNFGYPGTGTPMDNQNNVVDTTVGTNNGLILAYEGQNARRGQDILMTNVLSFDVKVWDPINGLFVDIGSATPVGGPFSSVPAGGDFLPTNVGGKTYNVGGSSSTEGVLYNIDASGNLTVVGGRLNSTYGSDPVSRAPGNSSSPDGRSHFRFDTWHPNASINANTVVTGTGFYNQPPYFQPDPYYNTPANIPPVPANGYFYNEPPFVPAGQLYVAGDTLTTTPNGSVQAASAQNYPFPLSAIQITINYRDISSNQIREMTIIQSLIDRVVATKTFASNVYPSGVVVPTLE